MPKSLYIDPVKVREPGYIHFEDIPVCQYNKTIKQELDEGNYTREDLIRIYRDMAICREFEHMLMLIKTQANYNGGVQRKSKPVGRPRKQNWTPT